MKKSQKFEELYAQLNDAQRQAVDAVEGPVVVAAGPGTGKTQMLAVRIANILRKTDVEPENILALTFTNAGVAAMRERLSGIVGVEIAYRVGIYTFHSFCEEQIGAALECFPQFVGAQVADDVARITIAEEIVKSEKLVRLKTFASDSHYISDILRAIDEVKRDGITPEAFRVLIDVQEQDVLADTENSAYYYQRKYKNFAKGDLKKDALKDIQKNRELAQIYERYQEELAKRKLYDFADMIVSVVAQIEADEEYRINLQEQYIYMLVDEHQDTNDAQARLLLALGDAPHLDGRPNIFAVGDAKQSIYRFAGASVTNFQTFGTHFRDVTTVTLTNNYRSTQAILDSAQAVIAVAPEQQQTSDERLCAMRVWTDDNDVSDVQSVAIKQFPTYDDELSAVAGELAERIATGVSPREMAVFYRNNAHLRAIAAACERAGVPYVVASTQNALTDSDLSALFWLLRAVASPTNDAVLGQAMMANFIDLDVLDVLAVFHRHKYQSGKQLPLSVHLRQEQFLHDAGVGDEVPFAQFMDMIGELHQQGENMPFDEFFENLVRETGFLAHILRAPAQREKMSKLARVFTEIKKYAAGTASYHLSDFITALDAMERYGIALDIPWDRTADGVRLMTAHAAKGLEFDEVYITNTVEGVWGKRRNMRKFKLPIAQVTGNVEDERRLFYVAMTRARKRLTMTYAQYDEAGKERSPTQFLGAIPTELAVREIVNVVEGSDITGAFAQRTKISPAFLSAEYIQKVFTASTLSASTLNNYCQSPMLYFFRNIVRLPQAESRNLVFGNLIHGVLEDYFAQCARQNIVLPSAELLRIFQERLDNTLILRDEYKAVQARGIEALSAYWEQHHDNFTPDVKIEQWIGGVPFAIADKQELTLVGKIDKMELLDDCAVSRQAVRVIDYKTGTPWSKMDKSSRAKLERQMTFYKLLLDSYDKGKYTIVDTQLHFVETNADGICEIHTITPDDEAVRKLRNEITTFADAVASGEIIAQIADAANKSARDRALAPLVPLYEALSSK